MQRAINLKRRLCAFAVAFGLVVMAQRTAVAAPSDPDWLFVNADERRMVEKVEELQALRELDDAMKWARDATEKFPGGTESHLKRIQIASQMHRLSEEIPFYVQNASQSPMNAVARFSLAVCYAYAGNEGAYEQELKRALSLKPDYVRAREFEISLAWRKNRTGSEADALNDRLIHDHPDFVPPYITRFTQLRSNGASDVRLRAELATLLALPGPPVLALQWQDYVHSRDLWYDPALAIPLYDRMLKLAPHKIDVGILRADKLNECGRTTESLEALRLLLKQAPRHPQVRFALASILKDLHRHTEAIEILTDGMKHVKYDDSYVFRATMEIANAYYNAGEFDETSRTLNRLIAENPGAGSMLTTPRRKLEQLVARDPRARIRVLENVPFLKQKGNYCGPASLSMLLGYYGLSLSQDEIARSIFAGMAGEAPQLIREFTTERGFRSAMFEGSVKNWKALIDQEIPVLWLQMFGQDWEGHFMVVCGYDDIAREFIVHNPWYPSEKRISYSRLDDQWSLPSVRCSMVFAPEGDPRAAVVDRTRASFRLRIADQLLYITSGANLYRGFWRGLAENMVLAALGILLLLSLVRAQVFPASSKDMVASFVLLMSIALVLNIWVGVFRFGIAVSLLIGSYYSAVAAILMAIAGLVMSRMLRDYWRIRSVVVVVLALFGVMASYSIARNQRVLDWLPLVLIAGAGAVVFGFWLTATLKVRRARLGPVFDQVAFLKKCGKGYCARMALAEAQLGAADFDAARLTLEGILRDRKSWPRAYRDTCELLICAASVLKSHDNAISPVDNLVVEKLSDLARRWKAGSGIGMASRVLLQSAQQPGSDATGQFDVSKLLQVRRKWPALPGIPRAGFRSRPHLLVRLLPIIAGKKNVLTGVSALEKKLLQTAP